MATWDLEIAGDPPLLDPEDLAYLAAVTLALAPGADLVVVATEAGCRVDTRWMPPGLPSFELDGAIVAGACRSTGRFELAIAHELAHRLLEGVGHTHGDVWTLAVLLVEGRQRMAGAA